jgi:hypothetical protein
MSRAATVCLAAVIATAALVQAGAQQQCATKPGDEAAVANTLRGMYAAASAGDRPKVDSYFAPGFYMFDGGQRFDGDAIMDAMATYRAKGVKFVWTVTQPDVHIHCDHAWIAYINKGSIQMSPDAAPIPTTWLESADLERRDGGWKLVFFQSTRVPAE